MRLAWMTDIHLNFLEAADRRRFLETVRDQADAFVISGDIAESPSMVGVLTEMADVWQKPTYFVLGNHDFYRGSIGRTRVEVANLAEDRQLLTYLTAIGVVELSPQTGLVGHDGWADARLGDFGRSDVFLNDYVAIQELRKWKGDFALDKPALREALNVLGDEAIAALQDGSRYHGYKDQDAKPSLFYKIVGTLEFLEPLPTVAHPGNRVPMTDYNKIMERIGIREWVEKKGVKEVWLWGYHGGVLDLWESNMSGPFGDISNSHRDPKDLPLLDKTYTVYHYNCQRGSSEAVEDHMHQIEAVLNSVDGRDRTSPDQWDKLLFWGRFVGSDRTHKIVRPGCGWAHYPPNAEQDYDWANKRYVETDIEDWKPDGSGRKQRMNCDRWGGDSLKWFVYWMQNIPGADSGLVYQDRRLSNWWIFIGDFDNAMRRRVGLTEAAGRHRQLP